MEAPLAYDAVWAIAKAFNRTIAKLAQTNQLLEHFTYSNKEMSQVIMDSMEETKFEGVSVSCSKAAKHISTAFVGGHLILCRKSSLRDALSTSSGKIGDSETKVSRSLTAPKLSVWECMYSIIQEWIVYADLEQQTDPR